MSTESTKHFLVYCSFYTEARTEMFQEINPILESKNLRMPTSDLLVEAAMKVFRWSRAPVLFPVFSVCALVGEMGSSFHWLESL